MPATDVKYPGVTAKLVGANGNVFNIIAIVSRALKRAGLKEAASEWQKDAMNSHSFDEVLNKAMTTVNVE